MYIALGHSPIYSRRRQSTAGFNSVTDTDRSVARPHLNTMHCTTHSRVESALESGKCLVVC